MSIGPAVLTSLAADWYVAPGVPYGQGTGDINQPWNLQYALYQPAQVQTGDTICLRGGVYMPEQACAQGEGNLCCTLAGIQGQLIVVRGYQSDPERPTIDGGIRPGNLGIIHIRNGYVHFRDFQIMSSAPDHDSRCTTCTSPPYTCSYLPDDIDPALAFTVHQNSLPTQENIKGLKFINLVIHDTATPWYLHQDAEGAEVYGCIIYYNGCHTVCDNDDPERGHGHGIYMQNDTITAKKAIDNIVFSQFGSGIHCYSETPGELRNLHLEGNIVFNNGVITALYEWPYDYGYQDNITVGDSVLVQIPTLTRNYTYFTPDDFPGGLIGGRNQLGHAQTSLFATATRNYFVAQDGHCLLFQGLDPNDPGTAVITNNVFFRSTCSDKDELWDALALFRDPQHANSFFHAGPPTLCYQESLGVPSGVQVFVRPNQYEPGRAHVVAYNWAQQPTVQADMTGVLLAGHGYEVYDVENYYGPPIANGVYTGAPIDIPMTLTDVAVSSGGLQPPHTPIQFGAFVVKRTGGYQQEGPQPGGPE